VRLTSSDAGFAEDVVQDAFLCAWTHMEQLTFDQGPVLGWMRRVVHNLVMDGYRRKSTRPSEVDIEDAEAITIPDPASDVVNAVLVDQVLRDLWPQHRTALTEIYLRDRTTVDVGAAFNVPVGTVRSRVFNA